MTEPTLHSVEVVEDLFGLPPTANAAMIALVAGLEGGLGLHLLMKGGRVGRCLSMALLATFTVGLLVLGFRMGWGVRCSCLSAVVQESVVGALLRNLTLLVILALISRAKRDPATMRVT